MFYSPAFTFSSIYPLGFCRVPGFALGCCASFKLFWPLALVQQAQAAIVFVVLRRLVGAVLFRSSCPSPNPSYRFWLLALTFRSSRPAYSGRLTSPVRWFQFPVLRTFFVSLFFGFVNAWNPGLSNVFPFTFIKYLKSEFRFKRVPV